MYVGKFTSLCLDSGDPCRNDGVIGPVARHTENCCYYATAWHELGHWTGHETRLDRDIAHPFGSEGYAKEELRAEIASMILGAELGVGHDPGQHAAYVKSWIKTLENDPMEIFRATADAEKIQTYLLAFEQVQTQERDRVQEHSMDTATQPQPEAAQPHAEGDLREGRRFIDVPYRERDEAKALGARQDRQYLAVPYGERQAAKAAGARWDSTAKSWYAGPNADREKLRRWRPESQPDAQMPAISPREEFADALRSLGAVVTGDHPIMDGKTHRIETEGDAKGEKAGFYVGHVDGHPAGYTKNNRTGIEIRWKAKGIQPQPGVLTDRDGKTIYVPAYDWIPPSLTGMTVPGVVVGPHWHLCITMSAGARERDERMSRRASEYPAPFGRTCPTYTATPLGVVGCRIAHHSPRPIVPMGLIRRNQITSDIGTKTQVNGIAGIRKGARCAAYLARIAGYRELYLEYYFGTSNHVEQSPTATSGVPSL